ncbi:hypothetical protein O6H91_Y109600 [Diphasiastrum complanatum]|nr:hypothetical protein O6H91_Y109600 [Diphasiastrum complanatum]
MAIDEDEDAWLRDSPPRKVEQEHARNTRRQGKVFRLDDLLADDVKEKNMKLEREAKRSKVVNLDSSSSDEDGDEAAKKAQFATLLQECENQVNADNGTQEILKWGELIFGPQRKAPVMLMHNMESSLINRALSAARALSSSSEGDPLPDNGESIALELLLGNWLLPFVQSCGHIDSTLSKWAFYKMAYTRDKDVERAALKFLCSSFILQAQGSSGPAYFAWFPCLNLILEAVYIYGYADTFPDLLLTTNCGESDEEFVGTLGIDGPPRNLQSLLQFITSCCENRQWRKVLTISDVESLFFVVTRMWLDRHILFLSSSVQECMEALINQFSEDEWLTSCERLATLISRVSKQKLNILRVLRCLCGVHPRFQSLRKTIAIKLLLTILNSKESSSSVVDVVTSFSSVDLRRDEIDFFDLYYRIVLADICLCSDRSLSERQYLLEAWLYFLKCCSVRISSSDFRPYATKVRNRASYLWHNYVNCRQDQAQDQKISESSECSPEE